MIPTFPLTPVPVPGKGRTDSGLSASAAEQQGTGESADETLGTGFAAVLEIVAGPSGGGRGVGEDSATSFGALNLHARGADQKLLDAPNTDPQGIDTEAASVSVSETQAAASTVGLSSLDQSGLSPNRSVPDSGRLAAQQTGNSLPIATTPIGEDLPYGASASRTGLSELLLSAETRDVRARLRPEMLRLAEAAPVQSSGSLTSLAEARPVDALMSGVAKPDSLVNQVVRPEGALGPMPKAKLAAGSNTLSSASVKGESVAVDARQLITGARGDLRAPALDIRGTETIIDPLAAGRLSNPIAVNEAALAPGVQSAAASLRAIEGAAQKTGRADRALRAPAVQAQVSPVLASDAAESHLGSAPSLELGLTAPTARAPITAADAPLDPLAGQSAQPQQAQSSLLTASATPPSTPVSQIPTVQPQAAANGQGVADAAQGLQSQIEDTIEQIAGARELGRAARPEMTVRHSEFGAVSMRFEATGADLRVALSSRDPGFVPSVQAAIVERASESNTANSNNQSSSQQSGSQKGGDSHAGAGANQGSGDRYGSSPGSGQGAAQPYSLQEGEETNRAAAGLIEPEDGSNKGGSRGEGLYA